MFVRRDITFIKPVNTDIETTCIIISRIVYTVNTILDDNDNDDDDDDSSSLSSSNKGAWCQLGDRAIGLLHHGVCVPCK